MLSLTYLRGLGGLYIALAPTDAEAEALYLRAKPCVAERVPLQPHRKPAQAPAPPPSVCRLTLTTTSSTRRSL